ncbi:MAG: M16 family metallopeptidase [Candidatus Limnocylindrales bacterium]
MSATVEPLPDDVVIAERPRVGPPRRYDFPSVAAHQLPNGLSILIANLPGRPLVSASVVVRGGATEEPAELAGSTVLAARALSEGTERFDAIQLVEAAERLGASIHADAGWDALSASVEVPADRFAPALELVAETLLRPTFPPSEVERLRDERLNDLLQAQADPRRRAEQAFAETIYASSSPYHRPSGGRRETVEGLTAADLRRAYERTLDPRRATLVVAGDLGGQDVVELAERFLGAWRASASASASPDVDAPIVDTAASDRRIVRVVHRPGSVQTEIRIGHRGLPRRVPDFHAVSVMSAILGGLFNSRLNMKLREEKGYTYGAGAGFDMRRGAGPFAARAAVNTEVTVAATLDTLTELNRMRDEPVEASELAAARDFLVGVFPLRFETAGAVVGAVSGLAVHGLPLDELIGYRTRIEAVDGEAVAAAARAHLPVDSAAVVLVGDVDAFGAELEAAGLGQIVVERDEILEPAPPPELDAATPGPVDREDEEGPTAGAEEPDLPGVPEEPAIDS